jgi:hypothetical protein
MIHTYTHVWNTHTHIWRRSWSLSEEHRRTYIHMYRHTCIHTSIYIYIYICNALNHDYSEWTDKLGLVHKTSSHTYIHTYMYIHICMHACIHTYTHIQEEMVALRRTLENIRNDLSAKETELRENAVKQQQSHYSHHSNVSELHVSMRVCVCMRCFATQQLVCLCACSICLCCFAIKRNTHCRGNDCAHRLLHLYTCLVADAMWQMRCCSECAVATDWLLQRMCSCNILAVAANVQLQQTFCCSFWYTCLL